MVIDKAFHEVFGSIKDIKWNGFRSEWFDDYEQLHECYDYYDYYYAESELYIIRDRIRETLYFVQAKSPYEAYIKFASRSCECGGYIYKGRNYSYEEFVRDSCCYCCNYDECDKVPIMDDGSIMGDFRNTCRDFEYAD